MQLVNVTQPAFSIFRYFYLSSGGVRFLSQLGIDCPDRIYMVFCPSRRVC